MRIDIVTLFPKTLNAFFQESIIKIAQIKKLVEINVFDLRAFGKGKRKIVDDRPFGGGRGMIMRVDVLKEALDYVITQNRKKTRPFVILTDPSGKTLRQTRVENFAKKSWLIIFCGHYEGIDERFRKWVDVSVSIGDYILTGGELAAAVIVDSTTRLVSGVLEKEATSKETFATTKLEGKKLSLLEYPQYTRPRNFKNLKVPKILLSGNHNKIEDWHLNKAVTKTKKLRPDLLTKTKFVS